jgi:hypothetical protein
MLYEFALDPAAVAGWTSHAQGRLVKEAFRIGNGRVPACVPRRWKRMVWEAFRSDDQNERLRIDVLISYLYDRASGRRVGTWDAAISWLSNILVEHARQPFHAIVTTAQRESAPYVLCDDDLEPANEVWQVMRTRAVGRTAAEYAAAFRGLIGAAKRVVIVEPVFDPRERRFTLTLNAIASLEPIATGRVMPCLIVRMEKGAPTPEEFEQRCRRYLPRHLGPNTTLEIVFAEQKPGGERLHNRLIVSDVGSVLLGDSIDEGQSGETNDLALLDEGHHRGRLATYGNAYQAFNVVGRFRLTGIARS